MKDILYLAELKNHVNAVSPLSDDAFAMIMPYVEYLNVGKEERLYEQEKRCKYIYCIRQGIFRNFIEHDGSDRTRWFAVAGDFITSAYAWSTGQPSASSVEAVTKGEVWRIKLSVMTRVIKDSEEWVRWFAKMLIEGIGIWEDRDRHMISGDAYKRFKNFYVFKSEEIFTQIPLRHVASYLRIAPQTLSVLRRRLIEEMKHGSNN